MTEPLLARLSIVQPALIEASDPIKRTGLSMVPTAHNNSSEEAARYAEAVASLSQQRHLKQVCYDQHLHTPSKRQSFPSLLSQPPTTPRLQSSPLSSRPQSLYTPSKSSFRTATPQLITITRRSSFSPSSNRPEFIASTVHPLKLSIPEPPLRPSPLFISRPASPVRSPHNFSSEAQQFAPPAAQMPLHSPCNSGSSHVFEALEARFQAFATEVAVLKQEKANAEHKIEELMRELAIVRSTGVGCGDEHGGAGWMGAGQRGLQVFV